MRSEEFFNRVFDYLPPIGVLAVHLVVPQRRRERSKVEARVPLLFSFFGPFFGTKFVVVVECTSVRDRSGAFDAAVAI